MPRPMIDRQRSLNFGAAFVSLAILLRMRDVLLQFAVVPTIVGTVDADASARSRAAACRRR